MSYLGNTPAERYSAVSYQDLTGGTGTSFTLDYAVGSANEIEVFVNNVRQEPSVAYTVSGTALTMTGSIASTDDFYVVFQGKAQQTVTHPATHALEATNGTFTGNVDINGNELILDADADTKLYASTDDVVKMNIAGSEVFRFDSDGLKFNGDTAAANALDDYEEGTFSPTIAAGVTSPTYANQYGYYTKIGDIVYTDFYIQFSGTGSGSHFAIGSLPFNTGSGFIRGGGTTSYQNVLPSEIIQFYGAATNNYFNLYYGGSSSFTSGSTFTNQFIIGTFIYKT